MDIKFTIEIMPKQTTDCNPNKYKLELKAIGYYQETEILKQKIIKVLNEYCYRRNK
jgi:hypothetical protein